METNKYQTMIDNAKTKMELYEVAGYLNNHPKHVLQDKVTIMGFMSFDEAKRHCQSLLDQTK